MTQVHPPLRLTALPLKRGRLIKTTMQVTDNEHIFVK
jgi:hypothetical protein